MYRKVFAAIPREKVQIFDTDGTTPIPDVDGNPTYRDTARYYLIRARVDLPADKFYGRNLMYQVLVKRNEDVADTISFHKVTVKSFQEVWY